MSNSARVPYGIVQAYDQVLEAFRQAVEDAGGHVGFPDVPIFASFTPSDEAATVAFRRSLYLKGCPCRKLPAGRRLDVGILVLEEIARNPWLLKQSTVYVNYFVVSDDGAYLVQALHYDYVDRGQTDHPFFHLHLTGEVIPDEALRSAGFDLEVRIPEPPTQCWVTTRIPTPDMTVASVLYCLAAHHLGKSIFSQFAERVHAVQETLPAPGANSLMTSLQAESTHFKSSHWFAHMRE